jgi:SAM-dependent methyltransferase
MEYVENPVQIFAEAARVLEPGGVFCGSVSFLEPVHGRTYFNLSPHILEKLLIRNGFGDVVIQPGLNGFALMLWTALRRCGIPALARLALPLAFLMLAPFAAALYVVSWFSWRVGVGTGHLMRWISQIAPLEFAGHVMFCARKRARS